MPETGYSRSPRLTKGALVQLIPDIIGVIPNVIGFQYNPTTVTRRLTPWDPLAVDQTQRGSQAPTVQPFEVRETFSSITIELDATDELEEDNALARTFGIEPRLAALRKLTQASEGLVGDLIASATSLVGLGADEARRPTVAPILLILGPRVIIPVRVTSFSVEEKLYLPTLYPLQAAVTLDLEVLTPDVFRCQEDIAGKIAIAAYKYTRLQEDAAALLNIANAPEALRAVLPF